MQAMQEAHRKLITYRGGPAPPGASALKGKHIAGIVCGALVLLVATGILVWYFRCCGFCAKPKDSESEASATKKPVRSLACMCFVTVAAHQWGGMHRQTRSYFARV